MFGVTRQRNKVGKATVAKNLKNYNIYIYIYIFQISIYITVGCGLQERVIQFTRFIDILELSYVLMSSNISHITKEKSRNFHENLARSICYVMCKGNALLE